MDLMVGTRNRADYLIQAVPHPCQNRDDRGCAQGHPGEQHTRLDLGPSWWWAGRIHLCTLGSGPGRGWVLTLLCPEVPTVGWGHAQADPTRRCGNCGCPVCAFHGVAGGACQPEHDACRCHRGPRCRDRRSGASKASPSPSLTLSTASRISSEHSLRSSGGWIQTAIQTDLLPAL